MKKIIIMAVPHRNLRKSLVILHRNGICQNQNIKNSLRLKRTLKFYRTNKERKHNEAK